MGCYLAIKIKWTIDTCKHTDETENLYAECAKIDSQNATYRMVNNFLKIITEFVVLQGDL